MITPIKQPYICEFSKNRIDFGVKTDMLYNTSTVYPFLILEFLAKPIISTYFRIQFTNPENGKTETVDLMAVDGTSPENYTQLWQIPDSNFGGTLLELRNVVFEKLQAWPIFNAFFTIEKPIVELPGATPRITITAKEAQAELVMIWESNQLTTPTKKIRETNSAAYYRAGVRDGYELNASLYLETAYGSGLFSRITTVVCAPDENGYAYVDFSKFINDAIESTWTEYPVPFENELGYKAPNLRKYYVEFSETFANESNVFYWKSNVFYATWGGTNTADMQNGSVIAQINENGQFLTALPNGKRLKKDQDDWLAWMNGARNKSITIEFEFEFEEATTNYTLFENIVLQPFETFVFQCNIFKAIGEIEGVNSWKIRVLSDNEGISGVKLTTVKDDVENVLIIPTSGFSNDRYLYQLNQYYISFGGLNWQIRKEGVGAWVYEKNTDAAYPLFDDWSYFSGIEFDLFKTESYIENVSGDKVFYLESDCLTETLLYFNDFGVPETLLLSAEFQQNFTTSKEIATRTQFYSLNNLLPENYVFDASNVLSWSTQTMALSNTEAERIMPALNASIAFLKKPRHWLPVIVNAASNAVYKLNAFLQAIKIELVQANENKAVSFIEQHPDFEPFFYGGLAGATIKRNGTQISDYGSIVVSYNGLDVTVMTWNNSRRVYAPSSPITTEGLLKLKLTYSSGDAQYSLTKYVNHEWESIQLVYFATSETMTLELFMQSFETTSVRIDWGDASITETNVTTTYTYLSHTYATTGKKIIRLYCLNFNVITHFDFNNSINVFDFGKFTNLNRLNIYNGSAGNYYMNTRNLELINIQNTTIFSLNIGYQRNMQDIVIANCTISSDAFDDLLQEIWNFRKGYRDTWELQVMNLGYAISAFAYQIINGGGEFAGDGLIDNGIDVTII